ASSVQVFSEAASFSVAHIMSGWIGATELAAHQIAINLASVTFMFINGISNAGAVVTGYALGEKNINKIVAAGIAALSWCMIFELCFFAVFLLFPDKLAGIYTSDKQVGQLAARLIFFAALFQLSDGLQNIAIGLLRGLQDVRFSAIISFISYWLIMIPLCYWFAFIQDMDIEGIWLGFVIGLLAVAVLLTVRYVYILKTLRFD
ncbi:MAG: MATE family efflux transporter, partial [Chitinophagales bacterium]|nr:MATE family efflux transporter [Chitinophagales bacterium]